MREAPLRRDLRYATTGMDFEDFVFAFESGGPDSTDFTG